ncbi:MAG TPA: lipid-binding SYLF domain-containing protein [Steroidobacteraceae bacterium]|nr:lipid-binding SYLF domain-containing protein [Steroidobacteraceae bacterium]
MRNHSKLALAISLMVGAGAGTSIAHAQNTATDANRTSASTNAVNNYDRDDVRNAQQQVSESTQVVSQMKRDPKLVKLLQRAQGVFIMPDFGKGAAVVGARGGQGILLVRSATGWQGPLFYDFGGVSVGAQAGGAAGAVAMLLMTDKAVNSFKNNQNNWSLNANAGLTVVNYSSDAQASAGKGGDVIVWSDTEGLFAGASIGVSDIRRDDEAIRAYYKQAATPQQIFSGTVKTPHADALKDELPSQVAAR